MKTIHPAWRFILALKASRQDPEGVGLPACGGCELWNQTTARLSELLGVVQNNDDVGLENLLHDEDYRLLYDAYQIFNLSTYKVHLETFLLADIDRAEIALILRLDPKVLEVYVNAFFDTDVFETYINRHAYVAGIRDRAEQDLKKEWQKGIDYLKWRMGLSAETDAKKILTALLSETYYRFKASNNNKEAAKLCDLAVKVANKLVDATDSDKFMEDIKLALKFEEPDFKPFKH